MKGLRSHGFVDVNLNPNPGLGQTVVNDLPRLLKPLFDKPWKLNELERPGWSGELPR
jgi:hypothetical protein